MGIDNSVKILENNSAMADEDDRCKECGCLLVIAEEVQTNGKFDVARCKNIDCKKLNLIIRRVKL